ncbi:unnamed protein product [Caenorhabditis nigoni]
MDDEEEKPPVEYITVDSDSDTGGTITIRSDNKNMIRQRPPSPIPTLEESWQLMARRFEYLQRKIRDAKRPENTFCISCLAVKRNYNHGCLQTPWKEAFEKAFSGVSILNSAFVEHCWNETSRTAGPEAMNQKKLALSEREARQEKQRKEAQQKGIVFNIADSQDTSHSLDNIEVPIAKKENDILIHRYSIMLKRLQWLKHSDLPMAMILSNGSRNDCIFCIYCYKLHQIDSEECKAKENEREAIKQLHARSAGIEMLNKKVVGTMLEFLEKKHQYHLRLKNKNGPFTDSPPEEKPEAKERVTDVEMINAFYRMHRGLSLQTRPIELNKEDLCWQCFLPIQDNCQCPKDRNNLALTRAAQKMCKIARDFPTIDGVLKNRCEDFAMHEAGIHETKVEAVKLSKNLRSFANERFSSEYESSDEERMKEEKKKKKKKKLMTRKKNNGNAANQRNTVEGASESMSSDYNADGSSPSTSSRPSGRVWFHPDDVGYAAEAEEDSDDERSDDDEDEEQRVSNEKAESSFRNMLIVLNSIELGGSTISSKRFCKQYRSLYRQLILDEKNAAYSFAKKDFRKIRNKFDSVNSLALKLFKEFAYINKNKYQNLSEIDTLRQTMNRKRDGYEDTAEDGDDEESLKKDSDDSAKALPVEQTRRRQEEEEVGRPRGSEEPRDEEPPKKKAKRERPIVEHNPIVENEAEEMAEGEEEEHVEPEEEDVVMLDNDVEEIDAPEEEDLESDENPELDDPEADENPESDDPEADENPESEYEPDSDSDPDSDE